MERTPYSPPTARVTDASPPGLQRRPRSVTVAVVLLGLFVGLEIQFFMTVTLAQVNTGEISGLMMLLDGAAIGLYVVIGVLLWMGVSWARWALVLVAGWKLFSLRWGFQALMFDSHVVAVAAFNIVRWLAPPALATAAAIIVFGSGRGWFRPRS